MNKQPPQDMLDQAHSAIAHAYCPYSNYPVSACIKASDGTLFSAINVENAAYNLCCCAETNAITHMVSNGRQQIIECLVLVDRASIASPCGACRQRLFEFADGNIPVYLCSTSGEFSLQYLEDLLPHAFGPQHLETS